MVEATIFTWENNRKYVNVYSLPIIAREGVKKIHALCVDARLSRADGLTLVRDAEVFLSSFIRIALRDCRGCSLPYISPPFLSLFLSFLPFEGHSHAHYARLLKSFFATKAFRSSWPHLVDDRSIRWRGQNR